MNARSRTAITSAVSLFVFLASLQCVSISQVMPLPGKIGPPDTSGFWSGTNHWYNIADEEHTINPVRDQRRYKKSDVLLIADNILLYQKNNGGWPKNYDMLAILTPEQRNTLLNSRTETSTTFDNGATHEQIQYLAKAYAITNESRHRDACLRGLDFILAAQYPNGGWPQFFPDTSGYRKFITFNDGAIIGIMRVLADVRAGRKHFTSIDDARRIRLGEAFERGLDAILRCQILQDGIPTAWCQQHDHIDYRPRHARSYELPSISGAESAEIVLFLMKIPKPSKDVRAAVRHAVVWFKKSQILGIKVQEIKAPRAEFMYHTTEADKVVVTDRKAPPIWARFYELGTNRPFFCNRDGKPVYSLAEVERERRTGYAWYTYDPQDVLNAYQAWEKKWPKD